MARQREKGIRKTAINIWLGRFQRRRRLPDGMMLSKSLLQPETAEEQSDGGT
jgi:hypothetical protein